MHCPYDDPNAHALQTGVFATMTTMHPIAIIA